MPNLQRPTLTQYLIEERRRYPQASGALNGLLLDVANACKVIARAVAFGRLVDHESGVAGGTNVQGEVQQALDVLSNQTFIDATQWSGNLAGMVSEEMAQPYAIPPQYAHNRQSIRCGGIPTGAHTIPYLNTIDSFIIKIRQ